MDDVDGSDDDEDHFTTTQIIIKQTNPGLLVSPSAVQQEEELAFAACDTDQAFSWKNNVSTVPQKSQLPLKNPFID